jgi:hypothetical protein
MMIWLKLISKIPLYSRTDDDIEYLVDWHFNFETVTQKERDDFELWLKSLPLGVITPIPNSRHRQEDGCRIVRVEE